MYYYNSKIFIYALSVTYGGQSAAINGGRIIPAKNTIKQYNFNKFRCYIANSYQTD